MFFWRYQIFARISACPQSAAQRKFFGETSNQKRNLRIFEFRKAHGIIPPRGDFKNCAKEFARGSFAKIFRKTAVGIVDAVWIFSWAPQCVSGEFPGIPNARVRFKICASLIERQCACPACVRRQTHARIESANDSEKQAKQRNTET